MWRLRQELKALRGSRPAATIAAALGWSESRLTRMETTGQRPKPAAVTQLLDVYGASAEVRARIMDLVEGARQPAPWAGCEDCLPTGSTTYLAFEQVAQSLKVCAPHSVPSLMQTDDYAAADLLSRMTLDDEQMARCSRISTHRRSLEDDRAPRIWAVVDESALHRVVGSTDIMRAQMERLLALTGRRNVNLQILPFKRGLHGGKAPYGIFDTAENIGLEVVCVESPIGLEFVRDADRVLAYRSAFEDLIVAALTVRESADLIAKLLTDPSWLTS